MLYVLGCTLGIISYLAGLLLDGFFPKHISVHGEVIGYSCRKLKSNELFRTIWIAEKDKNLDNGRLIFGEFEINISCGNSVIGSEAEGIIQVPWLFSFDQPIGVAAILTRLPKVENKDNAGGTRNSCPCPKGLEENEGLEETEEQAKSGDTIPVLKNDDK